MFIGSGVLYRPDFAGDRLAIELQSFAAYFFRTQHHLRDLVEAANGRIAEFLKRLFFARSNPDLNLTISRGFSVEGAVGWKGAFFREDESYVCARIRPGFW